MLWLSLFQFWRGYCRRWGLFYLFYLFTWSGAAKPVWFPLCHWHQHQTGQQRGCYGEPGGHYQQTRWKEPGNWSIIIVSTITNQRWGKAKSHKVKNTKYKYLMLGSWSLKCNNLSGYLSSLSGAGVPQPVWSSLLCVPHWWLLSVDHRCSSLSL